MRTGRLLSVSSADIRRLKTLVQDRNTPQKHVWRAEIVLLTAGGVGTNAIGVRRTARVERPAFGAGRSALSRRGSTDCCARPSASSR